MNKPEVAVSIGIARGTIDIQELDKTLRDKLAPIVDAFQSKGGVDEEDEK